MVYLLSMSNLGLSELSEYISITKFIDTGKEEIETSHSS